MDKNHCAAWPVPAGSRLRINGKVGIVKRRIAPSVDPPGAGRAKKLAYARQTGDKAAPFVERWTGKFTVARTPLSDVRMRVLKARCRLNAR